MNRFISALTIMLFALPFMAWAQSEVVLTEAKPAESAEVQSTKPQNEPTAVAGSVALTQECSEVCSPNHSLRRKNRGISNLQNEIVPKGQWVFGGTVSYSTHSNNNYTFLIVEDIQSNGYQFKISPILGYAYARNSLVGVRFGYSRGLTKLDNASLSITSLDNAFYHSIKHSYNVEALWRKYIPLGQDNKRFALFAEVALAMGGSQSKLAAGPEMSISGTYAKGFDVGLGVNPGIAAFLTNNMAIEVNIGVFGFNYSNTRQISNQVVTGTTSSSQMNFKVNIFSIGLGASFYL
jgi:hypothetical protein